MNSIVININKYNIEIHCRFSYTLNICEKYITNQKPNAIIDVSEDEINYFVSKGLTNDLPAAECRAIQDKVNQFLLTKNCVMMHSAVVSYENYAYAFSANSGGGKSTQAKLWRKYFKDNAKIICGDFPILSFDENKAFVSGTPWNGKEGWGENSTQELKAIFFVQKSDNNSIKKLSDKEIIKRLFYSLLMPKDDYAQMESYLFLANKLIENIPMYELNCTKSIDAVKTAYSEIWGESNETE